MSNVAPVLTSTFPRIALEREVGCFEKIKRFACSFFTWLCNLFSCKAKQVKNEQITPLDPAAFNEETFLFYRALPPLKTIGRSGAASREAENITATERLKSRILESDKSEQSGKYQSLCYEQHTECVKAIYTTYFSQTYAATPIMGRVNRIPGNFGLWMPGVALVLFHLSQKYGLTQFYACQTLEGFSNKLREFIQNPKVTRSAFVLPCFSSGPEEEGFGPNFAQHKVAVVVEKSASAGVKIAILNAQEPLDLAAERIEGAGDIWKGWEKPGSFGVEEVIFRAILKANLPKNSQLFFTKMSWNLDGKLDRERRYGCESFAIQDALAFLRDGEFFNKIILVATPLNVNGFSLTRISQLPAAFMTGMQSVKGLNKILRIYQDSIIKTKNNRNKTLSDYMSKYIINGRNHYITVKSCRYNEIVLQMLKDLSRHEIDQCLAATLVV